MEIKLCLGYLKQQKKYMKNVEKIMNFPLKLPNRTTLKLEEKRKLRRGEQTKFKFEFRIFEVLNTKIMNLKCNQIIPLSISH